ncbi:MULTISPECIES: response regulator transcription factor [Sorangium]|uniref:Response regulator n=1 Tax=Sorangium atrum TaxID=2995308 RepID=A0ABT5BZD5_9BACT|nr:response regulator [Sorangium aterium]MDC0679513.1 response regulator [Sorangium aterium]
MSLYAQERLRVLVVDDERRMLDSIAAILDDDIDVETCTSAHRALDLLQTGQFHVVCSDYKMPGMNGDELLKRVAGLPFYTSCLLITGDEEYIRSGEAGRHYVILKPFEPARVTRIVLELARLAHARRSADASSARGEAAAPASKTRRAAPSLRPRESQDAPVSSQRERVSSYPPPSSRAASSYLDTVRVGDAGLPARTLK